MRLPIALWFALGGCGFANRAASDAGSSDHDSSPGRDASALDAALDAAQLDAGATTGCLQRWFKGPLQFTPPQPITELSDSSEERDPWISEDGLRLYFARDPGEHKHSDIYLATRASTTAAFAQVEDLLNLSSDDEEDRPALTADELTVVLARSPVPLGPDKARIVLAQRGKRSEPFGSPDERQVSRIDADAVNHYDPFLSRDGLRLYLAPASGLNGAQQIVVARRAAVGDAFSTPVLVPGANAPGSNNADPALSSDERVLVYSARQGGSTDLWYATRPDPTQAFALPAVIPGINSAMAEGDPMLSADGCELYFSSTRNGGGYHIFHAQLVP